MKTDDARSTLHTLLRHIAPEVDVGALTDDTLLQEGLDIDSMDFLNLITALHDVTGIDVPERDYPQLATVGGFVGYVQGHSGS